MRENEKPAVSKETFKNLTTQSKLDILFDYVTEIHVKLNNTETLLEKTKMKNTMYASIFGFVGGAVAILGTKLGSLFRV